MAYKHHVNTHRRGRQARRLRWFAILSVAIVFLGIGAIGVDSILNRLSTANTVVTNETTTSVQAASVSVYRSPYFQFQAPDEWIEVADSSNDTVYVYVKNNNSLVEERLVVHVNRSPAVVDSDLKATYVLPVKANVSGLFEEVGKVSSHCDESWPDGLKRNPSRIVHEDISFVCSIGSRQYNVVFGEKDGDENLTFIAEDGNEVTLTIVYSNLTAYPSPGDMYTIAKSFSAL